MSNSPVSTMSIVSTTEKKTNKVVVLIQARMGSSRFPKKMMAPLKGLPMIEWVLRRSAAANQVDQVVLATSDLERDDVLAEHAIACGFDVFRGDESDVLGRFSEAAKHYRADLVVRICGDRPLVAPEVIDSAIELFQSETLDLSFNHIAENGQEWPRGFGAEVLSAELLNEMAEKYPEEYYREHVTSYVWEHRDQYRLQATEFLYRNPENCADLRFDVDELEDLELLNQLTGVDIHSSMKDVLDAFLSK